MKRIIGIDLDTTLVMLNVVTRASKELGYDYGETDTHTWNQRQFPDDLRERIFELFVDDDHMNSVDPIPGSVDQIKKWSDDGHTIHVITARAAGIRDNTIKLVERYYPSVNGVHFVDHSQTKIPTMKSLSVDLWIDDAPHGVEESIEHGFETYLISNKYTKYNWPAKDLPGIKIVKHVGEIKL
jgi:5'(3')-deoxyribonucleotidase